MAEWITSIDLSILHWIVSNVQNAFLDVVMPILTILGEHGIFCIVLSAVLIAIPKTRKIGVSAAIALALGFLVGNLTIKPLVSRIRPYAVDPSLKSAVLENFPLAGFPHDASFPSGHTLAAFEAAVPIFIRSKKWGIPALVLAFGVALSRLYLTVHYPTDVLAGAILGTCFAILASALTDLIWKKIAARRAAKTKAS